MILVGKPLMKRDAHLALLGGAVAAQSQQPNSGVSLAPANMKQIGAVDERYQFYNIEMLEVTGGKFWKPYKGIPPSQGKTKGTTSASSGGSDAPAGMSADVYQYPRHSI